MAQWQTHEIAVDTLLDKLRCAMLGYQQPCLPRHLITRSQQCGAIRAAAERLTFCFAITASAEPSDLLVCRKRLYAVLTYLLFECHTPDQTFCNLLRLMALEADVLTRMTERCKHTPKKFQRHYRRITDFDISIEPAILLYLSQDHRLPTTYLCSLAVKHALDKFFNTC